MCSSTRGPAREPSLVMCPAKKTGTLRPLAHCKSFRPHSRTCATLPGPEGASWVYKVWMESTIARKGWASSSRARAWSTSVSVTRKTRSPANPSRSERNLIWWGDSSPET